MTMSVGDSALPHIVLYVGLFSYRTDLVVIKLTPNIISNLPLQFSWVIQMPLLPICPFCYSITGDLRHIVKILSDKTFVLAV